MHVAARGVRAVLRWCSTRSTAMYVWYEEQQEHRRGEPELRVHGVAHQRYRGREDDRIGEEGKRGVEELILDYELVTGLSGNPTHHDRRVHDSGNAEDSDCDRRARELVPRRTHDRRDEQHRAKVHDGRRGISMRLAAENERQKLRVGGARRDEALK